MNIFSRCESKSQGIQERDWEEVCKSGGNSFTFIMKHAVETGEFHLAWYTSTIIFNNKQYEITSICFTGEFNSQISLSHQHICIK